MLLKHSYNEYMVYGKHIRTAMIATNIMMDINAMTQGKQSWDQVPGRNQLSCLAYHVGIELRQHSKLTY